MNKKGLILSIFIVAMVLAGFGPVGEVLAGSGWTKGKIGGAQEFNGSSDYFTMGSVYNGVKSVEFWIKADNTTKKIMDLNGNQYIEVSGGTITATGWTSPTIYVNGAKSSAVISANTWAHVVIITATGINATSTEFGRVNASYFDGVLDEIKFYSRILSDVEVRYHYNKGAPAAWWKFDEGTGNTVYDESENNNDGTLVLAGSATSSAWVSGKYGGALSFDGVNNYVNIAHSTTVNPGTDSFTMSAWIKPDNIPSTQRFIWKNDGLESYNGYYFMLYNSKFYLGFGNTTSKVAVYSSAITDKKWYFLTGVRDKTSGKAKLYINGVLIMEAADPTSNINYNGALQLGGRSGTAEMLDGTMDDVRIYKYARTISQIQQDYNAGLAVHFGPKTSCEDDPGSCMTQGLVGYWDMEEGTGSAIHDRSGNSNNGTTTNMTTPWTGGIVSGSGGKKGGSALFFDGNNDYVSVGDSVSLDLERTDSLSISAWIKTSAASHQTIVTKAPGGEPYSSYIFFVRDTGVIDLALVSNNAGGNLLQVVTTRTVNDGNWHHIVATYNGTSNSSGVLIYIDGVAETNYTVFHNNLTGSILNNQTLLIGNRPDGLPFNGLIDEVRIYNRALSPTEVRYHYNKGGPVGWWKLDEGGGAIAYNSVDGTDCGSSIDNGDGTCTAIFYSGTADGDVRFQGAVYATVQSAGTGDTVEDGDVSQGYGLVAQNYVSAGTYYVSRIFLPFDTSALPDNAIIKSATLGVYGVPAGQTEADAGQTDLKLYAGTQADALTTADYDSFGSNLLSDNLTPWEYPLSTTGYNTVSLNSLGLINITKTGTSKFACRITGDINASTPTGSNYAYIYSTQKGSGYKPMLRVVYAPGSRGILYGEMATSTSGSSGWISGKYGGALNFDGVNDYIKVGGFTMSSSTESTMEAWVNLKSIRSTPGGPNHGIFSIDYTGGSSLSELGLYIYDHTLYANYSGQNVSAALNFNVGEWHHVAATQNNSTGNAVLYFDGIEVARNTSLTFDYDYYETAFIGARTCEPSCTLSPIDGMLDDVRVYKYARTADQIKQDYNAGLSIHFR